MSSKVALTGNEALAQAMRQINPDVVAAYPITPQTAMVQTFSQFVADGEVDTEYVTVESEHSAMSATVGASAAGSRAMTATAANGLALMWEILYIASGTRLPIVMPVVNRALSGPINIHCDHSDAMGARDSGWIQLYAENAQEAYDNAIQAIRISEHKDVLLPTMVNLDGFITSHAVESLEILADEDVKEFVGEYQPENYLLNADNPIAIGPLDLQDFYFEHKMQQAVAMGDAKQVILDIAKEYKELTAREYGFFESYKLDDAEVAIVALNSTAGTAKAAVNNLREAGVKAGLLKIRVYRPFPAEEIADALKDIKAVAVLDRAESFSTNGGPVFADIRSVLYDIKANVEVVDYIYGLGGRDIKVEEIESIFNDLQEIIKTGQVENRITHFGVRQ
ncbi:pyruvate ferredoxin oxidoreductase alpha subunit [Orenia metallireducens]|uniref:Pyruvate ferredoxin oxidoreductase alpha subunit n=1 Tax=Orenia metallireducens TaxID=1413210 RepID=A0A285H2B0_9FIRM|nr:pyruvate ferredoxin oxidoreductase [Orenia metallireducens]PRX26439.1 pyruvate ferredoxin oxidoreductase alpha subunit [Orenia metallireducens]SNY28631.1 pyruvate ferredoxin oxidoreductase alpha subunit [Orenia metallireducens]